MTIKINNMTVNDNAPQATFIGVLAAYDTSGAVIPCTLHSDEKFRRLFRYFREQLGYGI